MTDEELAAERAAEWYAETPASEVENVPISPQDETTRSPAPGSLEWQRKVTASKVAAILGVSPWDSPRSVWHQMRGDLPAREQNDAMSRGHYLEPAILAWWRDQHRDYTAPVPQPNYTLGDWAAATPDALALWGGSRDTAPDGHERVLVEAKSAAYDSDWGTEGTDEIPLYYFVQVQWQMHVSGIHRCYVPVLTSRLRFAEYVVDYDAESGPVLEARCREFYDSLTADEPPQLDDSVATFETLKRLHPDIDKGEAVELTIAEADAVAHGASSLKLAEAYDRAARSVVLERMGRAQYATHNGVRVARRQANKYGVSLVITAKPADLTNDPEGDAV